MAANGENEALAAFLHRVWRQDVEPLLRDQRAEQRRKAAAVGGKVAAAGGLLLDTLLRLRGRPFTRAMSVLGTSFGAMLPDVWDWQWFRSAERGQQEQIAEQIRRRAASLEDLEALALFGLDGSANFEQLKTAWRRVSLRWHPDRAPDQAARAEYHARFVAYQGAYERLRGAYEAGRLPIERPAAGPRSSA